MQPVNNATVAGFFVLPILGGTVASIGFIAWGIIVEACTKRIDPSLSYGQLAVLICLPISAIIGAGIGLGAGLSWARQHGAAITLLLLVSVAGWAGNHWMWNDQIAQYGRDSSEVVLFYPTLAYAILALVAALIAGVMGLVAALAGGTR